MSQPSGEGRVKLTKAQERLLRQFADDRYGELCVKGGPDKRVVETLDRHGLVQYAGSGGWWAITKKGLARVS